MSNLLADLQGVMERENIALLIDRQLEQPIMAVAGIEEITDVVEKRRPCPFRKVLNKCRKWLAYRQGRSLTSCIITRVSLIGDMNLKQALHYQRRPSNDGPGLSCSVVQLHQLFRPLIHAYLHSCSSKENPIYQHVRRTSQSSMVSIRITFSICKIEDSASWVWRDGRLQAVVNEFHSTMVHTRFSWDADYRLRIS